jgi:hypothetical protein
MLQHTQCRWRALCLHPTSPTSNCISEHAWRASAKHMHDTQRFALSFARCQTVREQQTITNHLINQPLQWHLTAFVWRVLRRPWSRTLRATGALSLANSITLPLGRPSTRCSSRLVLGCELNGLKASFASCNRHATCNLRHPIRELQRRYFRIRFANSESRCNRRIRFASTDLQDPSRTALSKSQSTNPISELRAAQQPPNPVCEHRVGCAAVSESDLQTPSVSKSDWRA